MKKTKITLLLIALLFSYNVTFAQDDTQDESQDNNQEECMNNLSIFSTSAKAKKYDDAYESWLKVRKECSPRFNRNVYVAGEKILKHKIKNSEGADKLAFVNDLLVLYKDYNTNFESKFPKGKMTAKVGVLSYSHRKVLNLNSEQLYNIFDEGFNQDVKSFNDAKGLYIYFKMMVNLYDAKKKTPQDLFNKYDDVNDKIEEEVAVASKKLNDLILKEEAGTELTKKQKAYKRSYESKLKAFDQISGSVNAEIGDRATCDVLIPIYQEDFEKYKTDTKWLQRAMNKMAQKDCTDDPMFEKLVEQKNSVEPDAGVAYYLGLLKEKKGQKAEAEKYYSQSLELETDPLKKWKLVYRLAEKNRKKGSFGKARQYYRKALKLNPSNGTPYLQIARMYAKSANNCGTSVFNKRAVYWLAASEARKAGKVDARLKEAATQSANSYSAKAPTKTMIFAEGKSGQTITIGCWIGSSVRVP